MKQLMMILSAMVLTCCSKGSVAVAETGQTANIGKTLVVYYSYTGNCREIVNSLTAQMAADVAEIKTVAEGQDYNANGYKLGNDLLNAINANPENIDSYPAIKAVGKDAADYDNIIFVTPLWHSQMAAPAQTYLFQNRDKLAGKRFAMIVSSWSSGISTVVSNARRLVPSVDWAGDALWINHSNHSNRSTLIENWLATQDFKASDNQMPKMYITIDGQTMSATLVSNSSAEALVAALQQGEITYEAHDYGNFEKVGPLGRSFPQNNESITTEPGDLILYQGSNLCIYYDTNTWNFTRIGKIDDATQDDIRQFVKAGQGNVTVTLSLSELTGITDNNRETIANNREAYDLQGRRVSAAHKGVVIKNGKKIIR